MQAAEKPSGKVIKNTCQAYHLPKAENRFDLIKYENQQACEDSAMSFSKLSYKALMFCTSDSKNTSPPPWQIAALVVGPMLMIRLFSIDRSKSDKLRRIPSTADGDVMIR